METIAHLRQNGRLPFMELTGQRSMLVDRAERRGTDGLADDRVEKNETSIDGLPGHSGPRR